MGQEGILSRAVLVSLALWALAAPPLGAAEDPAPPAGEPLALRDLVRDAIGSNLALRSARAFERGVDADLLASKGIFDPRLVAAPSLTTGRSSVLVEEGAPVSGSRSGRALALGVGGALPLSTSYALALDHSWSDQENAQVVVPGESQPSASTALRLTLSQPLLKGAGPRYAGAPVTLAGLSAKAAGESLDRALEETIAAVESAYWSLGLSEAVERLSRDSYLRAEELLERNQRMRALELVSEVDLITARRGVQARLTSLTEASRRRQDAADRLLFLVYGDGAAPRAAAFASRPTEPPLAAPPEVPGLEEAEAAALRGRSDVRALSLAVEQGALAEDVARNALLPEVSLTGSVTTRTGLTDSFRLFSNSRAGDVESSDWSVGVAFSYPLSNRAARGAHLQSVWESRRRSLALASAEADVRSEVRAADRGVRANRLRLEQAELSFELARQQYEAGRKQLQLGLVDSFRLLQMEDDVTLAELVLVQVRYDLAQAITSYALAVGTLRERYGVGRDQLPADP